ncbi:MAG TPA: hypothetical protein VGM18_14270 [Candidatus Sulfotelmatobacter sp.]|jgi:hypothetical protein
MNRTTSLVIAMILGTMSLASAQRPQPASDLPDDLASQQLIAWSWMQKPQPAPQPAPPRDTPGAQPDQQATQSADPQTQQQTATQTFVGKIVWEGSRYVLKATDTTYQLDDQNLRQYENQAVKVVGNLNQGSNVISIVKIELLS